MSTYNDVYNFTNENVTCLKELYNLEDSKILSVVGSGDQYFTCMLFGAKQVDLFDINETAYLYFLLKFYSIRELTFEEFYDLFVLRNFINMETYNKLEKILPLEVLKYYGYLINKSISDKKTMFTSDGINLLNRKNKKYYFKNINTVIPYFIKSNYYKLKEILKSTKLPSFNQVNIVELTPKHKYDILLASNIYHYVDLKISDYVNLLKSFDISKIQAGYDWYGIDLNEFYCAHCHVNTVLPASPYQYTKNKNLIYTIKK